MWRTLGLIWACILVFAVLNICEVQRHAENTHRPPILKILKTWEFGGLYLLVFCHMFQVYYLSNSFKMIGYAIGLRDSSLTIIGSMGSLLSGFS